MSFGPFGAGAPLQPGDLPWLQSIHMIGTLAQRPPASGVNAGLFYLVTDVNGGTLYISTGSFWAQIAPGVTQSTLADNSVTNAKLADMANGTIKGRTTAGTGDPEDLTGDQATALLSLFGGAAGKGLVPSPGATSHVNVPFLLGDQGNWVQAAGQILASKYTATDQSTASTTKTDLATTDDVTISLDNNGAKVFVLFLANVYNTSAAVNCSSTVLFNGTEDTSFINDTTVPGANSGCAALCYGEKSLASGTTTVKVQHYVPNGGTGHWRMRWLGVYARSFTS